MPDESVRSEHRVCPWWLAYTFDNPLRRWLHKPEELFRGFVAPGRTAVDIGCGMGYFTIGLARMVGPDGRVIAVDLQKEMLARAGKRLEKAGMLSRVTLHQCTQTSLGVKASADFVLAFWMVHEAADRPAFLREVAGLMKPGAQFFVAEPRMHVSASDVQRTIELAREAGLEKTAEPKVGWSRAVVFRKKG